MSHVPSLQEYAGQPPFKLPRVLKKGPSRVRVAGYIWSGKARKWFNVSFVGKMTENGGMKEEYVIGQVEINKETNRIDEGNIRYSRFDRIQDVAKFSNLVTDFIKKSGSITRSVVEKPACVGNFQQVNGRNRQEATISEVV